MKRPDKAIERIRYFRLLREAYQWEDVYALLSYVEELERGGIRIVEEPYPPARISKD